MILELRRGPLFELSGGVPPTRDESWVDSAGVAVRAERQSREGSVEWIRGEARAET